MANKRSREFLEEVFALAKERLPGWAYAALVAQARNNSRRSRSRNRTAERALMERLRAQGKLTDGEEKTLKRLEQTDEHISFDIPEVGTRGEMLMQKSLASSNGAANSTAVNAFVSKSDDGICDLAIQGDDGEDIWAGTVCDDRFNEGDLVVYALERQEIVGHSEKLAADTLEDIAEKALLVTECGPSLGFCGPEDAKVLFVAAHPQDLELARKEALVGDDGEYFRETYLAPLGIEKSEAAFGFAVPVNSFKEFEHYDRDWGQWVAKQIEQYPRAVIVTLGKYARQALGDLAHHNMPHPSAVRKRKPSGEISRKLKRISKDIASGRVHTEKTKAADANSPTPADENGGLVVKIAQLTEERQVVEGVVLDPNRIDAHGDWVPPAVVQSTMEGFMENSQVIGLQHTERSTAKVVGGFIEPYPSEEDRKAAMEGRPHRVTRRAFGGDFITSGSWVLSAKLGDEDWLAVKRGEITGFSIGALTMRTEADSSVMPEVEVINLVPESGERNGNT